MKDDLTISKRRREHVARFVRENQNKYRANHGWYAYFLLFYWR